MSSLKGGGPHCRRARLAGAAWGVASALAVVVACPASAWAQKPDALTRATGITVTARPISSFLRSGGDQRRFGRLEFRGGLVLNSESPDFGGWSGLAIDPDGRRMMAVSDAGAWMIADLAYAGTRPTGLDNVRIGPIRATGGATLARGRDRDAEDIVLLDGTIAKGNVLVAFEQNHRIGRFSTGDGGLSAPLGYLKRAAEFPRLRANQGIEALAVMRAGPHRGAVVAFAEFMSDPQRNHTGWIWPKGPGGDPQRISLAKSDDFAITGAASMPDGSLVVLERFFRWTQGLKMRLRLVPVGEIKPGAVLRGETLIEADLAYEIDNMEAVAVHRGARGEAILTLISDNNYNRFLQRTLLLQFTLHGASSAMAPR